MSRTLDIDHLKSLIAIAETGSFSRAAELTHRTQAAVSAQMKRLEETVGTTLIERHARHSRLTPAGERLLSFGYRIVDLNTEAFSVLRGPEEAGLIRLGAPLYFGRLMPDVLESVAETNPELTIEITVQETARMMAALHSGELDLAIVTHQSGGRIGELIRREPMRWIASKGRDVIDQDPLPLALYHASSSLRRIAIEALERQGRRYRIAYSSPNTAALVAAVSRGLAVSLLPDCAIDEDLATLSEADGFPELPPCDMSLLFSPTGDGPLSRVVADRLREHLGGVAPDGAADNVASA